MFQEKRKLFDARAPMCTVFYIVNCILNMAVRRKYSPPGGLEPPTFRLTAERASQLRHGGSALAL
jgi:hypothetical protein